jgi:hypothetical protein
MTPAQTLPIASAVSMLHTAPGLAASSARESEDAQAGFVSGTPRLILRLEAAAVLVLALFAYARLEANWATFAALFLLPDLSLLAYLAGPRLGGLAYNLTHSVLLPALLALASLILPATLPVALIWAAHIGLDRMLGYGLKSARSFHETHLGRIGRA